MRHFFFTKCINEPICWGQEVVCCVVVLLKFEKVGTPESMFSTLSLRPLEISLYYK